jgi:hypothetical protein
VAGAPVFAVARDDEEKSARRAERTNAEGRFRFKNLKPDGYWCFYVDDPRFARECDRERGLPIPTDSADLPLRVRLYPPQSLTGTIVDEAGAAVPDVKVTLVREWLPGAGDNNPVQGWLAFDLQTTTGDREGRFRLERLRPGKIMVMLDHPEYARTLSDILPVEGGEARVTIRKGLTLHGRVLADGKPLPKVQVKVGAPNIAHRSMGQWELATSEAGEFEARHIVSFWEPEGQFVQTVTVQADDPAWRSDWYAVYQLDEQTLPPVEIQAWAREGATREPTMVQVGERRGIAGAPAGGTARVEVRFAGVSKAGQSAVLWNGEENARHVYRRGETGPDGKLVFAGLPAGRYRLGSPNYPGRDIDLSDGQSLQIVMEKAAGSIRGVVRVGGKPLVAGKADVVCYVITGGLHGSYEQFAGSVADDGQYQVDALPFGACALAVYLPRSGSHYYSLTVGTDTTRYDVDLPEGQVTAHLSQPAIDLQNPPHLRAERRDDAAFSDFQSAWLPFDAGGNCTLTNLAPGEYVLIATIPGQTLPRLGAARLDEPTAHVKVELRPPEHSGWIAGALAGLPPPLGASDTASVSMVAVPKGEQGYDPAGCYYGIVNAANGTYRVPDLPMGIYALWLRSSAVDKTIPVFFSSDVEVRGGLIRELDVAIPPGREVLIRLAYEGLQPAREVWRLRFPNGAWLAGGNIVGSHGSNAFTPVLSFRLPFGEYVVEADFGAGPPVARTFAVQPGEGVQEIVVTRP